MKTVLTDNSLCAYPLYDDVDPDLVYNYIRALKDTGVKYVELDFRTLMKLRRLPEGVEYIFRMVDPMFLRMTEFYDFKYLIITYNDLKKSFRTNVPIMFESPYVSGSMGRIRELVKHQSAGKLAAFRVRTGFDYKKPGEIADIHKELCAELAPYPVDICPLNTSMTALDTALKFTAANAESLTLTAGIPTKYCSLEEYLFTLMTMFDGLPNEYDIHSLGRVSVYRSRVFRTGEQALPKLLKILDHDIRCLQNADSGDRVPMRVGYKESEYLGHTFVSAVERMANAEDMPDDLYDYITQAIKQYDRGVFNDELLYKKRTGLLN